MAFEEMSGPRTSSMSPKEVYASFDQKSSPAGMTTHRPSASLLKDTPPSIVVALSQLAPIVKTLNTLLSLITWTGEDHWSSFLLLSTWWLACLYGDLVFHYAGNWLLLLLLGIGFFKKKTQTRKIVHAIAKGDDPITTGVDDTQRIMDTTLYEIDCLRARCHLLSHTFEPFYGLYTWENPERSALISMRLVLSTPVYVILLWFLSTRALVMLTGTFFLIFTSPWFKVICTVCWRLRIVRRIAAAAVGTEQLPGESGIMQAFARQPVANLFDGMHDNVPISLTDDSRFTTTVQVIENQRRWLGIGWTPSLLPHERAPFTDVDDQPGVPPDNTALPETKTLQEGELIRTVTWKWIDSEWRVEKDRGRDLGGWLYFDNTWRHPSASEDFGKYTRRRKWIRNAECTETVRKTRQSLETSDEKAQSEIKSRTISPDKVKFSNSVSTSSASPRQHRSSSHCEGPDLDRSTAQTKERDGQEPEPILLDSLPSSKTPRREWRELEGGGRELVTADNMPKKRPFTLRRKSSRGSTTSLGVDRSGPDPSRNSNFSHSPTEGGR